MIDSRFYCTEDIIQTEVLIRWTLDFIFFLKERFFHSDKHETSCKMKRTCASLRFYKRVIVSLICALRLWKHRSSLPEVVYRRTPIWKCDFNNADIQLYWNHFLAYRFAVLLQRCNWILQNLYRTTLVAASVFTYISIFF